MVVVAFFIEHHAVLKAAAAALLDEHTQRFIGVFRFLRPDDAHLPGGTLGHGQQWFGLCCLTHVQPAKETTADHAGRQLAQAGFFSFLEICA
jgi:hypothetical protein